MSAENVELARRGYEAMAREDLDVIAAMMHPEIKWYAAGNPREGCQSRKQALKWMQRPERPGVGELLDVIDAGDRVVVITQPRPVDGEPVGPRASVTTFRDGLVVEMVGYEDPADAFAAVGVPAPASSG